jgi:hypothetical protein
MRFDPSSASELIRATAILLLRIVQVHPSEWTQDARSELRTVELRVAVDEVLKGEVAAREATLRIEQRRADAVMDYLGLWFNVPLEKGLKLIAFSSSPSRELLEVLREGPCNQLLTEAGEVAEARATIALEERDPPIGEIFREASDKRAERGPLFVRWLWDRTEPEAMRSPAAFGQLAQLIGDEKTEELARETLANVAYQRLQQAQVPLPKQQALLVRALLRALAVPKASGFHANAEGVLLRNLLHLDRGEGEPPAAAVFAGHEAERKAALATVHARPAGAAHDRLLSWLERRASPSRSRH